MPMVLPGKIRVKGGVVPLRHQRHARMHDTRHSVNSLMAAAGVPDHIRAAWCGHSLAVNVGTYTHARTEDMPVAAATLGKIMNAP
jgi:integrase